MRMSSSSTDPIDTGVMHQEGGDYKTHEQIMSTRFS
jgi:hypothetical protein